MSASNVQPYVETVHCSATVFNHEAGDALAEEVKQRAEQYANGLITTHELVMSVHAITQGGMVQSVDSKHISIVFNTMLPIGEVVTTIKIDL